MRPGTEAADPRSLAPREHGAYGQLFVPLAAALAMGSPSPGALAIALAAIAVFFAHEPALVLLGRRGERARREDSSRARSRLALLGWISALGGAVAVASAPRDALVIAAVPLGLGALVGWLVWRGEEKTASGEMAAAAALAAAALPVALASGVPWRAALGAWGAWTVAFGAATWAVRTVIAHRKTRVVWWRRVLPPSFFAAAGWTCAALGVAPWFCAAAAAPALILALALAVRPPHPRSLRSIGWSLVGASLAVAAILIAGARA